MSCQKNCSTSTHNNSKTYSWSIIQEPVSPYSLKHDTSNPVPLWGKIMGIISLGSLILVMIYSLCFS